MKFKFNDYSDEEKKEVNYVMVEKLDTETFKTLYGELHKLVGFIPIFYKPFKGRHTKECIKYLEDVKQKAPHLYDRCVELFDLVSKIHEIEPKFDLGKEQFGYDKTGKLKCLDL